MKIHCLILLFLLMVPTLSFDLGSIKEEFICKDNYNELKMISCQTFDDILHRRFSFPYGWKTLVDEQKCCYNVHSYDTWDALKLGAEGIKFAGYGAFIWSLALKSVETAKETSDCLLARDLKQCIQIVL